MRLRALAASAFALFALAGPGAGSASAAEDQAYAAALNYATPALVVAQGDALRFNNLDSLAQHDLTSDVPGQFGTPLISGGQSAVANGVQNLGPGNYAFHCSIHPWMHGTLTVAPAGGAPLPGPPSGPGGSGPAAPNPADLLPHAPPGPVTSSDWPSYGGDLANSRDGGTDAPSSNEVPTLGPVWSFQSTKGDFTGTPAIAGGVLVAGAYNGTVFALDAATGKLRWSRDLGQPIDGSPAIARGRVFVPLAQPSHPRVAALSLSDGSVLWQTQVDSQKDGDVYGSPVVWTVPAFATKGSRPASRRARHRRRHHHRRHHRRRHHAPAVAPDSGQTVFIGTSALFGELNDPDVHVRGSVVALNAATGAIRWKTFTVPPGHDGGAVWSTPAIDAASGRLYVGTGNAYHAPAADTTDSVLAFDTRTGQVVAHTQARANDVWNGTSNAGAGPDYDFGASPNLFTGPKGQKLVGDGQKSGVHWALDRTTLKPVWTAITSPGTPAVGGILGSTAVDQGRIFGPATAPGHLWGLAGDGSLAWLSADGPVQFSAVSAGNGIVYSTSTSGTLTARDAATGLVLAKLPIGAPSWGGVALAGGSIFAVTGTEGSNGWIVAYRPRG